MTRIEQHREEMALAVGSRHDYVTSLCIDLRTASNGSSDPIPDKVEQKLIALLKERLELWTPSYHHGKKFDDCVKALIEATIEEVEHRKERTI